MPKLNDCLKRYTTDQDKAAPPAETVARVRRLLEDKGQGILAETRRIDSGRLDIPVFLSMCGPRARAIMPTRKQMGKGASPEQAEASALMELMERYSFFSFWNEPSNFEELTYAEAETRWPGRVVPVAEMLAAVHEELDEKTARAVLALVRFRFTSALHVASGEERMLPLDFFKLLNEFNGSSAGNTFEEAVLQGGCELVERHVSAIVDHDEPVLPTVDPASLGDPVVERLMHCYQANGVKVWLKDFTLGMPVATIGALAYDPETFPGLSEIVFTAGTAASPAKAVIRALTEVAQLAGDFHTGSNYEASGLAKYTDTDRIGWLTSGEIVAAGTLPDIERDNIREEIDLLAQGLAAQSFSLYAVETTDPELNIPAVYMVVPGFRFRERSPKACLGLFVGRMLTEYGAAASDDPEHVVRGLKLLAEVYPDAPFVPFYEGMAALATDDLDLARLKFERAAPLQSDACDQGLSEFYVGYALTRQERWSEATPHLDRAIAADPEVKEYYNLRGVALYKAERYEDAARDFRRALDLDSGSVMDLANLGLCCKALGRNAEAADYLRHALELDPALDFAREHLATLEASADSGS